MTDNDIIKALECGHMRVTIMQNNQNLPFLRKMGGGITMDVREKLVELLKEAKKEYEHISNFNAGITNPEEFVIELIANHLIAHGVTVQELDGCEYCKEDSEGFRRMFGAFSLVNPFHGKTWQIHAGKCKPMEINFCPMCGRRLHQPPKGE